MPAPLTILGAGSWGTALSVHLAQAARTITLWTRNAEAAARMTASRHNPTYLPEVEIPHSVNIVTDLGTAVSAAPMVAFAVPSQGMRDLAQKVRPHLSGDETIVSLAKGIENDTLMTMSQVLADVLGRPERIGALYGPSHAEEVAENRPTTVVAAAPSADLAHRIQKAFLTDRLRVYVNTDVIGVEIGGSAKNVLAIAAGISDGVGYGDNAKAALVTRGIAEIRRLGRVMGANPQTFAGLTGIGDLVVTCMSQHSRNRHLGEEIGRGKTLDEVLAGMDMVAEGVRTTQSIHDLAQKHDVEMPITEAVYAVLFRGQRPHEMMETLMTRSAKHEHWRPAALQDPTAASSSS